MVRVVARLASPNQAFVEFRSHGVADSVVTGNSIYSPFKVLYQEMLCKEGCIVVVFSEVGYLLIANIPDYDCLRSCIDCLALVMNNLTDSCVNFGVRLEHSYG